MHKPDARWTDDSGATMVEYALMVAFVAVVALVAVVAFGDAVLGLFRLAADKIASVI